jgi:hypothetical protein
MTSSSDIFTYDLLSAVRRNPKKALEIEKALSRIEMVSRQAKLGKASRDQLSEAQAAILPLCGFNFGLLIPSFFPSYPEEFPLSLLARPFMFAMTCLAPDSVVTFRSGRQVGKCVTGDTVVSTDRLGAIAIASLFDLGIPC